jgi:DNA gyrase/topoisomerase IV subunit A
LTPEIEDQPYTLTALAQPQTQEEATTLDNEIERLEKVLKEDVVQWEERLKEVKKELAGKGRVVK